MEKGAPRSCDISSLRLTIAKENDIDRCLEWFCSYTQCNYAVYHLGRSRSHITDSPYVRTNYPASWVQRYLLRNYVEIDPVVQRGFNSAFPFYWDELKIVSSQEVEFFQDAMAHNTGMSGFSIPLCDKANRRALFSLSSEYPPQLLRKKLNGIIPELIEAAGFIHQKVIADTFFGEPSGVSLSPREIECLSWVACGKDSTSISIILGLSDHTVRDYLKSARFKLGCATIAQAIHKATVSGILENSSHNPLK